MMASARWSRYWRKRQGDNAHKIAEDTVSVLMVLVYANVQSVLPETSRVGAGDFESP